VGNELVVLTDRSRTLAYQRCPRSRWLEYEYKGLGIRPNKLNTDLWTGTYVHIGVNGLLSGKSEDESVGLALEMYWPEVRNWGLVVEDNQDASYVAYEQGALTEALVRLYARYVLPRVLERFQIVETEREDVTKLVNLPTYNDNYKQLFWQSRCDALLLEKETSDLYVHSLKTAKTWGQKEDDGARHDMQGLSEIWAVDDRLRKWQEKWNSWDELNKTTALNLDSFNQVPNWFIKRAAEGHPPHVQGVKMEYLLKGIKDRYPPYGYGSPLIRPWKDTRDDLGRPNYAWKYDWKDELGNGHKLGPKYRRVNIWEGMGVKNWMNALEEGLIQPGTGNPFESQVVLPIEYFRNDYDTKRWLRQTQNQESRIAESSETANRLLASGRLAEFEEELDRNFPQHSRSCDWPTRCPYQEVCFGPEGMLMAPEQGGYRERVPHHQAEVEKVEKGKRETK
jgi:hypothetical protein